MIQLEQAPIHQKKPTLVVKNKYQFKGLFIGIVIISVWAVSLGFLLTLDISKFKLWMLVTIILGQTFLYTGLFITAHDAMHGVVFPQNPKINHFIGALSLSLYGLLPYQTLLKKHWLHHHNPASEVDPDFHNGKHKNFFAWYFHFMKGYWSWRQVIAVTIIYNVAKFLLHIPGNNLNLFWVVPSLLSSLQLFYFGTFLPHSEPAGGYIQPHNARTIKRQIWWSFITCYHFGYHEEHHEYPHIPWWQLPEVYARFS
ncbi:beta-carotene ketolase CrtW [Nostoc sp. UHCC 0302]|uniref:beta-carotene ketolase CrtW n=1 Tax=Nostoc sp. UHCC 0302 TaxID=3134896 RepID=UPI00311CD250